MNPHPAQSAPEQEQQDRSWARGVAMNWLGKSVKCTECGAFHYVTHTWLYLLCSTRCIESVKQRRAAERRAR